MRERIVSCVQIFPRPVRIRGVQVPMAGIGTVFTAPAWRRRGLGEALLRRASDAMAREGALLSALFAAPARSHWYEKLGWQRRLVGNALLRGAPGTAEMEPATEGFDPARDGADVRALHERYSGRLDGSVVRDDALWEASLANAGNPDERFRVVRREGRVTAYLRTAVLGGLRVLLEAGRADDRHEDLCAALASEVGALLVTPALGFDPPLRAGLEARGIGMQAVPDPTQLWRCLDAERLATLVGVAPATASELLGELLPR